MSYSDNKSCLFMPPCTAVIMLSNAWSFMHSTTPGVSNSTVHTIRTFLVVVISVKNRAITRITVCVFPDDVCWTGILLVLHTTWQRDTKPHWTCAANIKATVNTCTSKHLYIQTGPTNFVFLHFMELNNAITTTLVPMP